jgi:putative endonuclease
MQRQGVSTRVLKDHAYWVYIMASASGTLYVGKTNDLGVRVRQHKAEDIECFSKRDHCHRLVYYESYDWVHRAIGGEKQLKGWRRSKKIALIESKNPRWKDLSEGWGRELLFRGQSIKEADEQLAKSIKLEPKQ